MTDALHPPDVRPDLMGPLAPVDAPLARSEKVPRVNVTGGTTGEAALA